MVETKHKGISSKGPLTYVVPLVLSITALLVYALAPRIYNIYPDDFHYEADIVSYDNFYDESTESYTGEVRSKTKFTFETAAKEGDKLNVANSFEVSTLFDEPIFSVTRNYAVDQVNGTHTDGFDNQSREGYLFAPMGADKSDFLYWHINYDAPALMKFAGEEDLFGEKVYRYEADYSGVVVDQTDQLSNLPGVPEDRGVRLEPELTLWVEPITGWMVKYADMTTAYYYDQASGERIAPWNSFRNTMSDDSVAEQVDRAAGKANNFLLVSRYIPLLLFAAALMSGLLSLTRAYLKKPLESVSTFSERKINAAKVVAMISVLVSIVVLVGWVIDNEVLKRLHPSFTAMNPMTVVAFLILAVPFLIKEKYFATSAKVSSIAVIAIGLAKLVSELFEKIPSIDLLLFRQTITDPDEPLSLMSRITAVSFVLLGVSLLTFSISKRTDWMRQLFVRYGSLFAGLLGATGIFGYLTRNSDVLSTPLFFSIALHTAILFVLLGAAFHASMSDKKITTTLKKVSKSLTNIVFLIIPFAATILAWQLANASLETELNRQFEQIAERQNEAITSRLDVYSNTLRGGVGLFDASEAVSREEWKTYSDALNLQVNYPGIQGLGYNDHVTNDQVESYESRVRDEGFSDFEIFPEGTREFYVPVTFIEPFDSRNQEAFGFDISSETVRREGVINARDSGQAANTAKITLKQETDQDVQAGFLMLVPRYAKGTINETVAERRANIIGYITAPFRMDDLIDGIFQDSDQNVLLEIYDGDESQTEETLLYRESGLDDELKANTRVKKSYKIYNQGRPWTVVHYADTDFGLTSTEESIPNLVLLAAGTVAALVTLAVSSQVGSRNRAEEYADSVTKDLRKFQQAVQSATDAIIFTTPDQKVVFVNPAWERLTGYTLDEIKDKGIDILKSEKTPKHIYQKMNKALKEGKRFFTEDIINIRKDGAEYNVQLSIYPIKSNRKTVFFVGIQHDISKRKDIDYAKTEFVSLASHQLRTPLSAVNWYTEMLMDGDAGKLNDEQLKYANEIAVSNKRMVELVDSLLNVSRIETDSFTVEPEQLDITKISKEVIKELMHKIDERQQELVEDYEKDMPETFMDRRLVKMIIQNLLSNASKYTPEKGKIKIRIFVEKISGSKTLCIEVSDNGFGIPADEHKKIFNKLFRASNVTSMDTDGTGLGLYIVKSIVERCGGKIWFKSAKDKGTTFFIELPEAGMKKKKGTKELNV